MEFKQHVTKHTPVPPLPSHVEPPKPMSEQELQEPAPTPAQLKETLRRVLAHVVTPDKLQHLIFKMYDHARNGDKWAAQLLFDLIRGAKESDSHTPEESNVPRLTKKQVEEELAKMGFISVAPSQGLTVKQVSPDPGTPPKP